MRKWLFFIGLLLLTTVAAAQTVKTVDTVKKIKTTSKAIKKDTSNLTVHYISKAELQKLRTDPDYIYKEQPPAQISLWDRFWSWFWGLFNDAINYSSKNPVLKYMFISLGVALVGYIVYRIMRSDALFVHGGKSNNLEYDILSNNIHDIDYEKEISALIAERKYRLAIRLLYLRSLKQLSDKNIITWQPNKTNYAYVNEVRRENLKAHFRHLTLQFDYIWYGHFPVDEQSFEPLKQAFNDFNSMIK